MAIIIYPIKGIVGRRTPSDFSEKLLDRSKSKLYSTTPIIMVSGIFRVVTTLLCVSVRSEFRRQAVPFGLSMFDWDRVPYETATATGVTIAEKGYSDYTDVATFTNAFPK